MTQAITSSVHFKRARAEHARRRCELTQQLPVLEARRDRRISRIRDYARKYYTTHLDYYRNYYQNHYRPHAAHYALRRKHIRIRRRFKDLHRVPANPIYIRTICIPLITLRDAATYAGISIASVVEVLRPVSYLDDEPCFRIRDVVRLAYRVQRQDEKRRNAIRPVTRYKHRFFSWARPARRYDREIWAKHPWSADGELLIPAKQAARILKRSWLSTVYLLRTRPELPYQKLYGRYWLTYETVMRMADMITTGIRIQNLDFAALRSRRMPRAARTLAVRYRRRMHKLHRIARTLYRKQTKNKIDDLLGTDHKLDVLLGCTDPKPPPPGPHKVAGRIWRQLRWVDHRAMTTTGALRYAKEGKPPCPTPAIKPTSTAAAKWVAGQSAVPKNKKIPPILGGGNQPLWHNYGYRRKTHATR